MTKDRIALLTSCWEAQFRTCACGRCGCAAPDPVVQARRVFAHWADQHADLADRDKVRAAGLDKIAADGDREQLRISKKYAKVRDQSQDPADPFGRHAELRAEAAGRRRSARRNEHAAELYRRLSRGEPPFPLTARAA